MRIPTGPLITKSPQKCALPDPSYIRRTLGNEASGKFMRLFSARGASGRLVSNHYPKSVNANNILKLSFGDTGQKVPPLIVVTPEEVPKHLRFYPVTIPAAISGRQLQFSSQSAAHFWTLAQGGVLSRGLKYLNNFLLVLKSNGKMILIIDDHTHAAYGLALAERLGIFNNKVSLFHIDEHEDNLVNPNAYIASAEPADIAKICKTEIEINQFLAFACQAGLLDKDNIYYFLTKYLDGTTPPYPKQNNNKTLNGGKHNAFNNLSKTAREIKQAGGSIAMNLDLDFFAFLYDPLVPSKDKEIIKDVSEGMILPPLEALAKAADFIVIATSPDYFNVDEAIIRRLIKAVVEAA